MAKVQAELKAQQKDLQFVNEICQLPSSREALRELRQYAYYRKDKEAPFLAVCHILAESLESAELNIEMKFVCCTLLVGRLQKASTDPHLQSKHCFIFNELERKFESWIESINAKQVTAPDAIQLSMSKVLE